jgi:hypothetical protein
VTTIPYDLPMKDLIAGLDATGHVTHRSYAKKSVTIHHNGGRLSHEGVLEVWKTRAASAHFDIDSRGAAAQYVRVHEYAWAVGNTTGNIETISIEQCDLTLAPKWEVAEVTWKAAARLAGWLFAHVVEGTPRPSPSNLHYHHFWKSTDCAGPYMDLIYAQVLAETQRWYDHFTHPVTPPPQEDSMSAAEVQDLKNFIEARTQAYAVANNEYTRQVLSTATKAVLDQINEVDAETATAVQAKLDDDFKALSDQILAQVTPPAVPPKA